MDLIWTKIYITLLYLIKIHNLHRLYKQLKLIIKIKILIYGTSHRIFILNIFTIYNNLSKVIIHPFYKHNIPKKAF